MKYETLWELIEKYNDEIPKSIILKTDIINRGVSLNREIVNVHNLYLGHFSLNDGTSIITNFNDNSPYSFHSNGDNWDIYYEKEPLEEVNFMPLLSHKVNRLCESNYINIRSENCLQIFPIISCQYCLNREGCLFCGMRSQWKEVKQENHSLLLEDDKVINAINLLSLEMGDIKHVKLTGGSLLNLHREAEVFAKFAHTIKSNTAVTKVQIESQAFEQNDILMLKDAGIDQICFDMEIWDKDLWSEILPGKSRNVGRETWLHRLLDSVKIFGKGNISTSFVVGFEWAYINGFSSLEEAYMSNIEGFEFLIKNDIEPIFFPWINSSGLLKHGGEENKEVKSNYIPTSYYLELGYALHNLFIKYNFYKFLHCQDQESIGSKLNCYRCSYHSISADFPRLITKECKQ